MGILNFYRGIVHKNSHRQRQGPPSVMMLIFSCKTLRTIKEVRIERGIDRQTIKVLRQLPRKTRIISPVSPAAMSASRKTPLIDARTKIDWSNSSVTFSAGGNPASMAGKASFSSSKICGLLFTRTRYSRFPTLAVPGRKYKVLEIERVRHVGSGELLAVKCFRVQIHHHLRRLAIGKRNRCALHRGELRADEVLA